MSSLKRSIITAIPLLFVLTIPALGLTDKSFLLRVESQSDLTSQCEKAEVETLIFQDGLVIRKSVNERGKVELYRLMAPPDALRRLTSALRANRVGIAQGNCSVPFAQPNTIFDATITWFGKAGRSHTFDVSAPGGGSPCPEGTNAIFKAVNDFVGAAFLDSQGERVVIQVPPSCE